MAEVTAALAGVSELAVLRALERAGNRLPRRPDRSNVRDVPPWELHTHLPVDPARLDRLMSDAWDIPRKVGLPPELIAALDNYTRTLLISGHLFDRMDLQRVLFRLKGQLRLPWETNSG
ncbi:hypothetical protein [Streptomyces achromogenes]|uniref:hypothetical protein n=1 Tax=Streptomyces achromogenes TaxID=67255 RepID=UPI003436F91D